MIGKQGRAGRRRLGLSLGLAAIGVAPLGFAAEGPLRLTVEETVERVLERNDVVAMQSDDRRIAEEELRRQLGRFQPVASFATEYSGFQQRNTVEEQITRADLSEYERDLVTGRAGVSFALSTGGTVELLTNTRSIDSILQPSGLNEYRTYYGLTLDQPLARGAGRTATMAPIEMARADVRAASARAVDAVAGVVASALAGYLDLRLAQEQLVMWDGGLDMARRLLEEARRLAGEGRLPETAVLDVESSLLRYEAGQNGAMQNHRAAMNRLRSLLMASARDDALRLEAVDALPAVERVDAGLEDVLAAALAQRPDFVAGREEVDKREIAVELARNRLRPQLDLIAAYGVEGLEDDFYSGATDFRSIGDQPQFSVGLEFSMPVGMNQQARAELARAELELHKAQVALRALEVSIANDLDTSLAAVRTHFEQWNRFQRILEAEERLLEAERSLLAAGRADMRNVLTRQEVVMNARNAVLAERVAYAKARIALELSRGVLPERYGFAAEAPAS